MPIALTAPRGGAALAAPIRAVVRASLTLEARKLGEIAVVLTDDAALRELNKRWRGIDRATDVISFAYDELEPDAATLPVTGDLVISLDRLWAQAKRYRVSPGNELARLLVHGTLHLCGHDHHALGERRTMRRHEAAARRAVRARVPALDRALARLQPAK